MRKNIISAIAILSLVASIAMITAYAQSAGGIKFEAPFEFTVGGKTLPAGKYSIQRLNFDTPLLVIRDEKNRGIMNFMASKKKFNKETATVKLIFHRYGAKSFLKQIQYDYTDIGYELPKSSAEREAIKKKDTISSAEPGTFEVVVISGQ